MEKVKVVIDKKINDKVKTIQDEFSQTVSELNNKVGKMQQTYADSVANGNSTNKENQNSNVVIKNLTLSQHGRADSDEDTKRVVEAMIRDGLKLTDVKVKHATRKTSRDEKPGVVIATIETHQQKQKLMKEKCKLKNSSKYRNVYIQHELSRSEQNTQTSLITILKEIGKDKDYHVNGSRIVSKKYDRGNYSENDSQIHNGNRQQRDHRSPNKNRRPKDTEHNRFERRNDDRSYNHNSNRRSYHRH